MPRIAQRCYLVSEGTGWAAFVPVIGGFIKTHWCVVVTKCPWKMCQALPGEPCIGRNQNGRDSRTAATHFMRRKLAQKTKEDPKIRRQLRRAMPAVAFALDALTAAFAPKRAER
jgi:hypothetical protein